MRYGFAKDGSFVAIDDEKRISEFAFVSSEYWDCAKKNPEETAKNMLSRSWKNCPDKMREEHYALGCKELAGV